MSPDTTRVGGFSGDPAEALNPPESVGGCCGTSAPAASGKESTAASTCCGTVAEVGGGCCGAATKREAVASGAGCCG